MVFNAFKVRIFSLQLAIIILHVLDVNVNHSNQPLKGGNTTSIKIGKLTKF